MLILNSSCKKTSAFYYTFFCVRGAAVEMFTECFSLFEFWTVHEFVLSSSTQSECIPYTYFVKEKIYKIQSIAIPFVFYCTKLV